MTNSVFRFTQFKYIDIKISLYGVCGVCVCSDYGFERSHMEGNRCFADFWHDPDSPPEDCHLGQTYESSTGSVHAHTHILSSSRIRRSISISGLIYNLSLSEF